MNYVRNAWYVGGWSTDLQTDRLTATQILGEPFVLWRTAQKVVALADCCVHRPALLSLGRCAADRLRCMHHGLLYDTHGQWAQQRIIDLTPDPVIMPTAHDRGVTLFNGLVARLAREETA